MLLHSQQFEKAVAFLSREERSRPTAALADMGEEALHFALALQHEGLLACAASGVASHPFGRALYLPCSFQQISMKEYWRRKPSTSGALLASWTA